MTNLLEIVPVKVPQEREGTYRWDKCMCRVETSRDDGVPRSFQQQGVLPPICMKVQGERVITRTPKDL